MNFHTSPERWAGVGMALAGLAFAAASSSWLAFSERRRLAAWPRSSVAAPPAKAQDRRWLWVLAAIVVVGALVRLIGIGDRGYSHIEIYIPGIDLPAGISEPPPRHGFIETVLWHFHFEPHPMGWYLAMWAWAKVFGTGLLSIRLPEMILGALSIPLIYRCAAMTYGRRVGLVAAALLSLHGFHVFWSQIAKMYAAGGFWGLVSTWLLLEIARRERPSLGLEIAYVAATLAGVLTVELFWPLIGAQILWTALKHRGGPRRIPRLAVVQTLAFVLATPALTHAAMNGRGGAADAPTLGFLGEYFSYAFAFMRPPYTSYQLPLAASVLILASSLVFIVRGLAVRPLEQGPSEAVPPAPIGPVVLSALGMAAVMFGLALLSFVRVHALMAMSILPLAALLFPFGAARFRSLLARAAPGVEGRLDDAGGLSGLIVLQALVPPLTIFLASYLVPLTAQRAFLIYIPYLLIVIAAGVVALARRRFVAVAFAAALSVAFAASVLIAAGSPNTPRDYQGLARAMNRQLQPGDLVFALPRNYADTPMFVYLDHRRLVASDYAQALRRSPSSRVWVLSMEDARPSQEMMAALRNYRRIGGVRVVGQEPTDAILYARKSPAAN
jgi:hypothetical protein